MNTPLIYPSLLDVTNDDLESVIKQFDPLVPGYHIDIMDGVFVPNLTRGIALAHEVASLSNRPKQWVHLMVENPEVMIRALELYEGSIVSFHIETKVNALYLIDVIIEKKLIPSIALSPKTNVEDVFPFLNKLGQVLIMSVEPGYSGQRFMQESLEKVKTLAGYRATSGLSFRIGIDGGITGENIGEVVQAGANDIAVSSAIFSRPDPLQALNDLQGFAGTR